MRYEKLKLVILLAAGTFAALSCEDHNESGVTIPEMDSMFVISAADGGMFEVKAGEIAEAKGDSSATGVVMGSDSVSVKSFGQIMISDHTKANNELKSIADRKGVAVPTTLSSAKQMKLDSLSAVSGQAFNIMYTRMMVASHEETVALFEKESGAGQDAELKSWATQKLPTLMHHLEMSEMLYNEMK
jgi:putative membrane protein